MEKTQKQKVVVYVVHKSRLLVFRHTEYSYEEVGIQVPAGSIEASETPEQAALRELREETGFDCFEVVFDLGTQEYDMTPYRAEIQERHFFLAKPTSNLPERWDSGEGDIKFECFWIPIEHGHVLQSGQGAMLWKTIPKI